ncbi:MAG: DUF1616 domain-containing protein, partial [Thermoplasmata archaeon]
VASSYIDLLLGDILSLLFVLFFFTLGAYPVFIIVMQILAIPFLIFLPGYMFVSACFPTKRDNLYERFFLSICASLCIIPFVPFLLNYIGPGIGIEYVVPSIMLITVFLSLIAFLRRYDAGDDKFTIGLDEDKVQKSKKKKDSWNSYNSVISLMLFSIIVLLILLALYLMPLVNENRARLNEKEEIMELYLTPADGSSDFPHFILRNQTSRIKVCIDYSPSTLQNGNEQNGNERNGRSKEIRCSLVAQVVDNSQGSRVSNIRYVESWDTVFNFGDSTLNGYERNLTFGEVLAWSDHFSFTFSAKGEFVLEFLLFLENSEGAIRGVSTWIKVN